MHNGVVGPAGVIQFTMSMKAQIFNLTLQSHCARKLTELEKGNVIYQVNREMAHPAQVSLHRLPV